MTEESNNMIERTEPNFCQFADGEEIEGILIAIEFAEVNGKRVARYTTQRADSPERDSFLGTAQINQKLRQSDLGHIIRVRCEGKDDRVIKNGNAMKKFKVFVSEKKAGENLLSQTIITDDDIPF